MKYLIIIFLNLILCGQILADCTSGGIWAYPSNNEISQNSIIVIEAYATSQRIINSLNVGYPIFLEANEHTVQLKVVEVCEGMFLLTQAILQPEERLREGEVYQLKIENLTDSEQNLLMKWKDETNDYESISWKVTNSVDTEIPKWKTSPKLVDKTTIWFGCGPAIHAIFDLEIEDNSETLIETELVDVSMNETYTYYLTLNRKGKLRVGHGMCSGAFGFQPKNKYKVRFSLTDLSGNSNNKWTEWVSFDSPYEDYDNQ